MFLKIFYLLLNFYCILMAKNYKLLKNNDYLIDSLKSNSSKIIIYIFFNIL